MNRISIWFVLSSFLWVAACVPTSGNALETKPIATTPVPAEASAEMPAGEAILTVDQLMNSTYTSPLLQKAVQLSNGSYTESDGNGTSTITLLPQIALGDLNGDGSADGAILLAENGGGSGVFVSLVVVASMEGGFFQAGDLLIDDRPQIQALEISDGEVRLTATIHGLNDNMAEPTLAVKEIYRLLDNQLTLTKVSSTNQGGTERSIQIESPAEGSVISGEVEVKGSMPVAPFENNLRLTVYDMAGNVLDQSGFMVSAADMGMPATFDNLIQIPEVASGQNVRIELADLSAADGSVIALDSVVVTVE